MHCPHGRHLVIPIRYILPIPLGGGLITAREYFESAKAAQRRIDGVLARLRSMREREGARVREWVRADPARIEANRERAGRWQRENRERYNARHRAWRREHRHEIKVREVMRKLRGGSEA